MPWKEVSVMEARKEFVLLLQNEGTKVRPLCRQFGISPTTAYKWLKRYRDLGNDGLVDKSRRPHLAPKRTTKKMENLVLEVRHKHKTWGGRKIYKRLLVLGIATPPQPSTITKILHRNAQIAVKERQQRKLCQRFERNQPNELWQMDFKGHFQVGGHICHPLSILDDHSRFVVSLKACPDQKHHTVQSILESTFKRYGMPQEMLMDNGTPWRGNEYQHFSLLTAWLMRLGIRVIHGRPRHPQTQGKAERFNGTLQAELLQNRIFRDLRDCQKHLDKFRELYNFERPHQALDMDTPGQHYHISVCRYPGKLPPIKYGSNDIVKTVDITGRICWKGKRYHVGKAFREQPVAIRTTLNADTWQVYYCHQWIATIEKEQKE